MSRRDWIILWLVFGTLAWYQLEFCQYAAWVGHTDLTVEFVVTDAATGAPLPGCLVAIQKEVEMIVEIPEPAIPLRTNEVGVAHRSWDGCGGGGKMSRLRLAYDTYSVSLPY